MIDVPSPPLAACLDDFWSAGLSAGRLRGLPAVPATAPDLLLRMFDPPAVRAGGRDLAGLPAPAYQRLASPEEPA